MKKELFPDIQLTRTTSYRKDERRRTTTIGDPLQAPTVELVVPNAPAHGLKVAVITDTQVKPGVPIDHIAAAGKYIARKRPDVNVIIGDWWDFPSLSSYDDPGSMEMEGRRYKDDLDAGHRALYVFKNEIAKEPGYNPLNVFLLGNHEYRIKKAVSADPQHLDQLMSFDDLRLGDYGFTAYPFLQPVVIGGVAFCHFFPSGVMGRPITTPSILLKKLHMSAFAGHQQGRDIAYAKRADGRDLTAIISGSFYQHDENYLSPFTNRHWRGMYMLHEVKDGSFDEMAISINYLKRKFG